MTEASRRVRTTDLQAMKRRGEKIAMLTAYDATFAGLLDRAGIDVLLVGDSLGMVVLGERDTLGVTLDAMVHHTRAVSRGATRALVVADMPFLTYHTTVADAVRNAGRLLQEGGAAAVKLEGGFAVRDVVARLVDLGIPVMGHLGLLPQSIHQLGGFRPRATSAEEADRLLQEARALEAAGAFSLVLESIPPELATTVTGALAIPTIGIGAGPACDGQVLVGYDALGLYDAFVPPFVKQYARLSAVVVDAARAYADDVRTGRFPRRETRPQGRPDVIATIGAMRTAAREARARGRSVGLVPTMGALHAGHGRLIERARADCGFVAVSIFVNPIQFDETADYRTYPRALAPDVEFCAARGVDVVFAPADVVMYPDPPLTFVEILRITDHLCGRHRPGHFRGVATVVAKLLNVVQPDRAYFGEKDAQQLAVVRRLVRDLDFPVEIVPVETVREPDGLAMSSRNLRLTPEERPLALALHRALRHAADRISSGGADAATIRHEAAATIPPDPRLRLEYLEIVEPETMQPVERVEGTVRVAGALWVGEVRLIDNLLCAPARR